MIQLETGVMVRAKALRSDYNAFQVHGVLCIGSWDQLVCACEDQLNISCPRV
jgi:hypothetical protein